jgi:DNA-directed RNA polymerase subunit M/transcription elongation factor TFIIS
MAQPQIAPERVLMSTHFRLICSQYQPWEQQPADRRETLIRRMERNCFEVVIAECIKNGIDRLFTEPKFMKRYNMICSRVLANLNVNGAVGSTYLIDGLISGRIDPYSVAEMDSHALCPEASAREREQIALRQSQKIVLKVSRAYFCSKCKGDETIPIEYQGRASDEGSSRSIKCMICGYIWRKS